MWAVLNAILYVVVQGCVFGATCQESFQHSKRCTPISAIGVKMAPGLPCMTVYGGGLEPTGGVLAVRLKRVAR